MSPPDDPIERRYLVRVGQTLRGKWVLDKLLGVGGMASVYAATHRNGKRGAVKLLHHELSIDENARSRFLREGYVANKVDHPGTVSVLDDDTTEEGDCFLVMELLDGETLAARAEARPGMRLGIMEVVDFAEQTLDVLIAAHENGIVHRDLKPDNLFMTRNGRLKVLDFGIARLRDLPGNASATKTGSAMGTPAYMPPEQALGNWADVDARSDLWAVGATMFAMLTGRPVHVGDTINKTLLAAMTASAPPVASMAPNVPPTLAAIIDRALAFRSEDRWPNARSMKDALVRGRSEDSRGSMPISAFMPSAVGSAPTQLKAAPAIVVTPASLGPASVSMPTQGQSDMQARRAFGMGHTMPTPSRQDLPPFNQSSAPHISTANSLPGAYSSPSTLGLAAPGPSRAGMAIGAIGAMVMACIVGAVILFRSHSTGHADSPAQGSADPIATAVAPTSEPVPAASGPVEVTPSKPVDTAADPLPAASASASASPHKPPKTPPPSAPVVKPVHKKDPLSNF